ncbi:PREDICTED: mitotic interactor and substrate of PLK1 [Elephantulus edwardii]|uniref:mitotic interactor and substrate of PLK1 n=1 Tax=Elephantulus edwardii TaxID=28737 RepID=UPI0003F0B478|nr:PREDICTED: mitotic interactor and substrate of PLK1 [Elephantulus edwardii]
MDRVTRYPIFGIPHSPRVTSQVFDEDISYSFQLVGVGPEVTGGGQDETFIWPSDHGTQLDTEKAGRPHNLHATPDLLSSRPLHTSDKDKGLNADHLDSVRGASPRWLSDLERERQAVIQNQVVRRRGTVATQRSSTDQVDGALARTLPEPVVDTEQIDFLAARRQFLNLEQANTGTPQKPWRLEDPGGAALGISKAPKVSDGLHLANGYGVPTRPHVKEVAEDRRVRSSSAVLSVPAARPPGDQPTAVSPPRAQETPIEREIRLAQEREADLREQRGLQPKAGHQELVEIPTRSLLATVGLAPAPRRERGRPSLYVQRDMVQETLREEDHRRQGLQGVRPATPDWSSSDPQPSLRRAFSSDSILDLVPNTSTVETAPEVRRVSRIPFSAYEPYLSSEPPRRDRPARPSPLSTPEEKAQASPKARGSQLLTSKSSASPSSAKQERSKALRGPPPSGGAIVRPQYFRLRPLRFGVPDVKQPEVPRARGWEAAEAPAMRLHRSASSELLEREVESALRREREVAEERRAALFPEVFCPTPADEDPGEDQAEDQDAWDQHSRASSRASGVTGSYSVSEPFTFSPVHLHSGLVWTVDAEAEPLEALPKDASWQRKGHHQWYAGIDPSDHVNSEILEATRVTRHKNIMAERWEAHIYASEDED